jgi:carbonic anhydrase
MSIIDDAIQANEEYSRSFTFGHLPMPPARKLAIVACMDARLSVEQALGLKTGDAHIIRNAGGILTEDALRSLIISHHLLGTQEFMFIHHTDCGMLTFKDDQLASDLRKASGTSTVAPARFHAFSDVEDDVRLQIERARSHPWLPKGIPMRGFVYDVKTGSLREVTAERAGVQTPRAGR